MSNKRSSTVPSGHKTVNTTGIALKDFRIQDAHYPQLRHRRCESLSHSWENRYSGNASTMLRVKVALNVASKMPLCCIPGGMASTPPFKGIQDSQCGASMTRNAAHPGRAVRRFCGTSQSQPVVNREVHFSLSSSLYSRARETNRKVGISSQTRVSL